MAEYTEVIRLIAQDDLTRGVSAAEAKLRASTQRMTQAGRIPVTVIDRATGPLRAITNTLSGVARMAAGVALGNLAVQFGQDLVGQFTSSISAMTEFGAETRKLQLIGGGTAEEASTMLAAFERFGVGVDQAGVSIGIFAKHLQGIHDPLEDMAAGVDAKGKPLKGFADTMHDLGVSFQDAKGHALPMGQVILDVADQFHSMADGTEKTALAMTLFGRSGRDMIPVLNQGREGLQEAMDTAAKYGLQLSGANVEAIRQFGLEQKNATEAVSGLKIQLGLALLPVLAALAAAGTFIAQGLNQQVVPALRSLGTTIQPIVTAIRDSFGAAFAWLSETVFPPLQAALGVLGDIIGQHLGPLLIGVAAVVTGSLLPVLGGLVVAALAAGGALLAALLPVIVPVLAIAAVVELLKLAWDNDFGGIQEATQSWWTAISGWFGQLVNDLLPKIMLGVDAVKAIFVAFTDDAGAIGIVYDVIRKVFGDSVADFLQPFLQWFMDAIPGIVSFVGQVFVILSNLGGVITKVFAGDFRGAADTFMAILGALGALIGPKLAELGQAFIAWVAPLIPPLLSALGDLLGSLGDWILMTAAPAIIDKLAEWAGAFVRWIPGAVAKLAEELPQILTALGSWVSASLPQLLALGNDLANHLAQGILDVLRALGPELLKALGAAWDAAKTGFLRGLTGGEPSAPATADQPTQSFASGGWLREPVVGFGMQSGRRYTLAERHDEYVVAGGGEAAMPGRRGGAAVNINGPVTLNVNGADGPASAWQDGADQLFDLFSARVQSSLGHSGVGGSW